MHDNRTDALAGVGFTSLGLHRIQTDHLTPQIRFGHHSFDGVKKHYDPCNWQYLITSSSTFEVGLVPFCHHYMNRYHGQKALMQ